MTHGQECPGIGDDIPHAPLVSYSSPDYIASDPPSVSNDTKIDLVFDSYIESPLLSALNTLQSSKKYTKVNVQSYSPVLIKEVLGLYAQQAWNTK